MDIKEAVLAGLKELILPELNRIKEDSQEIKTAQLLINKRLDDTNMHLIDQSRRIDEVNKHIDERIGEVNGRIGEVDEHINEHIDKD
jgi:small-conductance mechanosensitive channel